MQDEGSVERRKKVEAKATPESESRKGARADWEVRSDLAAVGLKFWALDWESLERPSLKVPKRLGAEREESKCQGKWVGSGTSSRSPIKTETRQPGKWTKEE